MFQRGVALYPYPGYSRANSYTLGALFTRQGSTACAGLYLLIADVTAKVTPGILHGFVSPELRSSHLPRLERRAPQTPHCLSVGLRFALTPNTVELIPALGALSTRGGPVKDPILTLRHGHSRSCQFDKPLPSLFLYHSRA